MEQVGCLAPVRGSVWIRTSRCPCMSSFSSLRRNRWKNNTWRWRNLNHGVWRQIFPRCLHWSCSLDVWGNALVHVMLFLECPECRFNQSNNHKARKCAPCAEQWSCVGPVFIPEATIYCHQSHWLPKYITSPQSQSGSFILNVILSIVRVFMLLCVDGTACM